jgi:uncharacterized membrane protein
VGKTLTPVTPETFKAWKEQKLKEKEEQRLKEERERQESIKVHSILILRFSLSLIIMIQSRCSLSYALIIFYFVI